MRPHSLFLLFACACLLGCQQQPASQKPGQPMPTLLPAAAQEAIDALFDPYNSLNSPGYAVGISKAGQPLWTKGYGAANLDHDIPITPHSVFSLASVSKRFTAACLALLVLEGTLGLEDPVAQYIPQLAQYADTIRLKHLVYNTSGLTDYYRVPRGSGASWHTFNYFNADSCIAASLRVDTLLFAPGTGWNYCNTNFILLAKVVEAVSGQPFGQFAQERLFTPLGMQNTHINDDATLVVKGRVTPYNLRNAEALDGYANYGIALKNTGGYITHPRTSPHYGGSGVMSSVDDLLLWTANMESKALGEEFYNLMHATPSFEHGRKGQAFGLHFGDFNGRTTISWDGGDWGISSQLLRFPDSGVAIVVLSNLGTGRSFEKVNKIAEVLESHGLLD